MTRARAFALALVCLLAFGANVRALGNTFAMDDVFIVLDNPRLHQLDSVKEALGTPYWPGTASYLSMYRPVTTTVLALEWHAWQDRPLGYHAVNLGLHTVATALVFLLLAALVPGVVGPLAGAALWAVHPVHVEAVASVVGLGEILAATFVLLAALVYLRDGRGLGAATAIGAMYLAALGAKEIGATLPGLLLVLEAGRRRDDSDASTAGELRGARAWLHRVAQRWPVYAATVVSLGVYVALRVWALGTAVGSAPASFFNGVGAGVRMLTAVSVWPEYLRLMLFPADLVADYSPGVLTLVTGLSDPRVWLGLLVGGLAMLVVWRSWSTARAVALGVLWFVVAVLPVSNLVVPVGVLVAERTLYLPSVGLAAVVAGVMRWGWKREDRWRWGVAAVTAVAVALAGYRTWTRTPAWKDTDTIVGTLVREHPESFRSQWWLAARLFESGQTDRALELFRNALELSPNHYQLLLAYGRTSMIAGHYGEATRSFESASRALPDLPEAWILHMVALLQANRPDEAVAVGRQALDLAAEHRGIHHQMAIALTRTGDYPGALDARRASIRLGGDRAAHLQFVHEAELLLRLGRHEEAATALDEARERAPDTVAVPTLETLGEAVETADSAVLPYR